MSYVRWSSDGFRSDVYAYESVHGGFTLHIASRRRVGLDTLPPDPMDDLGQGAYPPPADFVARYRAYHDALDALPFESVDHPDAGRGFNFATLEDLRDKLAAYRAEGIVHVPEWVVPRIDEEIAEEAQDV